MNTEPKIGSTAVIKINGELHEAMVIGVDGPWISTGPGTFNLRTKKHACLNSTLEFIGSAIEARKYMADRVSKQEEKL